MDNNSQPINSTTNPLDEGVSEDSAVVDFRAYIEKEILGVLKEKVTKGEITNEKIQEIASFTLDLLEEPETMDELYRNAIKMNDTYGELSAVVIKIMREYEEKYNGKAVSKVSDLIKSGNYDEAQEMIKKVLLYKGI